MQKACLTAMGSCKVTTPEENPCPDKSYTYEIRPYATEVDASMTARPTVAKGVGGAVLVTNTTSGGYERENLLLGAPTVKLEEYCIAP